MTKLFRFFLENKKQKSFLVSIFVIINKKKNNYLYIYCVIKICIQHTSASILVTPNYETFYLLSFKIILTKHQYY